MVENPCQRAFQQK